MKILRLAAIAAALLLSFETGVHAQTTLRIGLAEDPDALQFGEDRLEGLLAKKGHGASASQWTARIEAAVRAFARGRSQFDDITCLALRR